MYRARRALIHQNLGGQRRRGFGDWLHAIGYGWLFLPVATVKGTQPPSSVLI
jgi:hypothetical protein